MKQYIQHLPNGIIHSTSPEASEGFIEVDSDTTAVAGQAAFIDGEIKPLNSIQTFFISANGEKNPKRVNQEWQPLACDYDDILLNINGAWRKKTLDDDLNNLKTLYSQRISTERDNKINAGIEFPTGSGQWFDSDPESQKNINGIVTLSMLAAQTNQPFSQEWITQNNTVITLDAAGVAGLGVAIATHVSKYRLLARTYKDRIQKAANEEVMQTIVDEFINNT